jgi:hypothetical protein
MDIISYQAAKKAKKAAQKLNDRIGLGAAANGDPANYVDGTAKTVKERLENLDSKALPESFNKQVSKLEENTMINLNKTNLKMEALLSKDRFKLENLVFDNFKDETGIDKDQSNNYTFDQSADKVKQTSPTIPAEIVTIAEETEETPQKITVSQSSKEQINEEMHVDLSKGNLIHAELVDGTVRLAIEDEENQHYFESGSYESTVIDLSENFKKFTKLNAAIFYRSISGTNTIPAMTSNIAPGGEAEASSIYNSNHQPWKAFNHTTNVNDVNDAWVPAPNDTSPWISYDFGNARTIRAYLITIRTYSTDGNLGPTSWMFEGSNDGENWTTIDSHFNQPQWTTGEKRGWILSNPQSFRYYRLNITDTASQIISIGELEMLTDVYTKKEEIYTATSTDNQTFTDYEPLNSDDTIASPDGRYIKVKIVLPAAAGLKEQPVYDFSANDESVKFQENNYIDFTNSLKLKTNYIENMIIDDSYTEEGTIFKTTIDKTKFQSIDKIEVW